MNKAILTTLPLLLSASLVLAADENKPSPIGYADTPLIVPGGKWKVHDIDRPRPEPIKPAEKLGDAPADAIILFDGKNADAFIAKEKITKKEIPAPWQIENGELIVNGGDVWTKESFASCQLHLEWKSEPNTKGNSQKKGNGGVFFMDLYETQILDCDNNPTYADGMTGGIYGQTPPLVNAVKKAGEWQTYDIIFTAPKLDKGKVVEPAYLTTFVNGICVQNHTKILGPTKHKQPTSYEGEFPEKAPIRLQDHKNEPPVRLRNIWIRPIAETPAP
jgi:hypothetical protein